MVQMNQSGDYNEFRGESDISDDDVSSGGCERDSIMGRLGLRSYVQMTEEEVESACSHYALGFRCDQYTLTERLHVERHERTVAEDNMQRVMQQSRDMLQELSSRLQDVDSRNLLEQMEQKLQSVEKHMEPVLRTAEMLGAAHQEARISLAMQLMCTHLEQLKTRHAADSREMLEVRKLLHRRKGRLHSDSTDDRCSFRLSALQGARRRVSITVLPTQAELRNPDASFLLSTDDLTEALKKLDRPGPRREEVVPSESPIDSLTLDSSTQDEGGDGSVFQCEVTPVCRQRRCGHSEEPIDSPTEEAALQSGAELVRKVRALLLLLCLLVLMAVCAKLVSDWMA